MANLKLSQITPSAPGATTDQIVGVISGSTDALYSIAQVMTNGLSAPPAIGGGTPAPGAFTTLTASTSITVGGATAMSSSGSGGTMASLTAADQTVTGGANVTSSNQGTKSSGTFTIDCGVCPLQYITNGRAFTLAAPANDGSCMLLVTNNASAGAITFSGFSVGSNTGDALTTTNTNKFTIGIWRINSVAGYRIAAHQ